MGNMTLDDLLPAPYNPRRISPEAAAGLRESLQRFADVAGITWNRRTGHLVSGHQRVDQLRSLGAVLEGEALVLGEHRFPVRVVDWDEKTERAANLAANSPWLAGDFEPELLDAALEALDGDIAEGGDFYGLRLDELSALDYEQPEAEPDAGDSTEEEPEGDEPEDALDLLFRAPFPWFGGKARVAGMVWRRFGDVRGYVEPFFGSGAVCLNRPQPFNGVETVNDADGLVCLGPDTRLLCMDLRWRRAGDIRIGDRLIGFDETNGAPRSGLRAPMRYRHWQPTAVTGVERVTRPSYRLTFDDGTTVVASADHQWLGGSFPWFGGRGWRWQTTASLTCNRAVQRSWILKPCDVVSPETSYDAGWIAGFYDGEVLRARGFGDVVSPETSYDAGWIAGFYDGEGHLRNGPGWRVNRVQEVLRARGFDVAVSVRERDNPNHQPVASMEINGGMRETLRFLMTFRPQRMIQKFQAHLSAMSLYGRSHHAVGLVRKEDLGDQEVMAIQTTTKTFIAEGLASHNCNFWRAVTAEPERVAELADWPANENDLHARHAWLVGQKDSLQARLEGDPDYYDAKIAGWWVWGMACWIGGGFCSGAGGWGVEDGRLVHLGAGQGVQRRRVHLGDAGQGVQRRLVHLGDTGRGVQRRLVHLGDTGRGGNPGTGEMGLVAWMQALAERLRRVRVCCGDWTRVCGGDTGDALSHFFAGGEPCGVFLDPPYSFEADRDRGCYRVDSGTVAHAVREWALRHGDDPRLRIALCGYEGEHEMPGWTKVRWTAHGGMGNRGAGVNANRFRERVWFSPHCLKP